MGTALQVALEKNHLDTVMTLLNLEANPVKSNIDVDDQYNNGDSLLAIASFRGKEMAARNLIGHGAQMNFRNEVNFINDKS